MAVIREALFVAFELPGGERLCAFWNGGRTCDVYALNGRIGPLVERWRMVRLATGQTGIEYHADALRELVNWRCADGVAVRGMTANYRAAVDGTETVARRHELPPAFSVNEAWSRCPHRQLNGTGSPTAPVADAAGQPQHHGGPGRARP